MNDFLQQETWLTSPWAWALVTGAAALWCLVPRGRKSWFVAPAGGVLGVICVGLLASRLPLAAAWTDAALFWLLASITVVSASTMISMRSPVYCAVWFAMTLLGVASLFLLNGAQLLGVATVAVYAGAIVVMFLFLIMLAQPEGHEYYDRISWASPAALFSSVAGAAIVLMLTIAIANVGDRREQLRNDIAAVLPTVADAEGDPVWAAPDIQSVRLNRNEADEPVVTLRLKKAGDEKQIERLRTALANLDVFEGSAPGDYQIQIHAGGDGGPQAGPHAATLGGVLFSRYLVAVEVAGTLLLIALVGAVAIVMFGREQETAGRRQETPPTDVPTGGVA